jgi:hypothetical protein
MAGIAVKRERPAVKTPVIAGGMLVDAAAGARAAGPVRPGGIAFDWGGD